MSINRQEFTDAGRDMLGRANNSEALTIAHVVVGETRVNAPSDLWPLDVIPGYVMDVVITQQTDQGDGVLLIDAAFNSSQAPRAFELCGVGVMAHIAAEPDRLYSVANVLATGADNVDPAVESIHAFKIKVVIDRAPNVTVVIGTSQDIMGENIGAVTIGAGVFAEKLANTLRFKRLVMGPDIEIVEDDDTITIGVKTLIIDLDLYVPLTNPGGTPDTRFPDIQSAIDYLDDYRIPANVSAKINVDAGDFTITSPIIVNHPDGQRISILGAPVEYRQVTNIFTEPNYINITLSSSAGIKSGDCIRVSGIDLRCVGLYSIILIIDGTGVQGSCGYQFAFAFNGPVAGTATIWNTRLICTASGFNIGKNGIGIISDFQLIGPAGGAAGDGINSIGPALFRRISAQNFVRGIAAVQNAANIVIDECACSSCSYNGFNADTGAFVVFSGAPSVANICVYGIFCRQASIAVSGGDDSDFTIVNNCELAGIRVDTGGTVSLYHVVILRNGPDINTGGSGIFVDGRALLSLDTRAPDLPSFVIENGPGYVVNILAQNSGVAHGRINAGSLGVTSPPNGSPPGTDATNGFISINVTTISDEPGQHPT
jgi:hypothetical protein